MLPEDLRSGIQCSPPSHGVSKEHLHLPSVLLENNDICQKKKKKPKKSLGAPDLVAVALWFTPG